MSRFSYHVCRVKDSVGSVEFAEISAAAGPVVSRGGSRSCCARAVERAVRRGGRVVSHCLADCRVRRPPAAKKSYYALDAVTAVEAE